MESKHMTSDGLPYCACGCGNRVKSDKGVFVCGHNRRGAVLGDKARAKISIANRGRVLSDDAKRKLSIAWMSKKRCGRCGVILGNKEHTCTLRCPKCGCVIGKKQHICRCVDLKGQRNCVLCGVALVNTGRMRYQKLCCKCAGLEARKQKRILKSQLVQMFGGKCELCGYHKFVECLEFHHINADEKNGKDFLKDVEKNPSRFRLWCNRCHREQHVVRKTDKKDV